MSTPTPAPQLRRAMGPVDLLLFVVITSFGIMSVARAGEAGAVGVTFWLAAGLVFYLPLTLCVIVLSSRYPGEGGLYFWSQQSFGEFAGFITGWAYWTCILPFLPSVLFFIAAGALFLPGDDRWMHLSDDPIYFIVASSVCLAAVTVLNILGLNVGKWLHNAGAIGTWIPALALMVFGFIAWVNYGPVTDLSPQSFVPRFNLKEAILWPIIIMNLTGLEAVSIMGDEIQDTRRRLPLALALAAALTIVSLVVVTLAFLVTPPPVEQEGAPAFMAALNQTSARAGVSGLLPLIAALVVVAHIGKVSAWTATAARLPLVAGLDRALPPVFARLHPRWGTPHIALLVQAAVVAILMLLGKAGTSTRGAYDLFMALTVIPTFVPFLFLFAAMARVQFGEPGPGRMRTPLGRSLIVTFAALGWITTALSAVLAVIPSEDEEHKEIYVFKILGLSAALLGAGVAVYFAGRARKSKQPHEECGGKPRSPAV